MASTGRNEPCPCGSGKKFKHCHGKLATTTTVIPNSNVLPLLIQAQQSLMQGNHSLATTLLRQAIEMDPSNIDAQHFLGMAIAFGGNENEGIMRIRASISAQPSNPLFRFNLAHWLEKTGNGNAAMRELMQAISLKPDYHQARYQLVKLAMERHMHALAKLHLDALLSVEPQNPELRYRLATTLLQLKEYTAMEREFRSLLAQAQNNTELHMRLGEGLRTIGRFDEAKAEFETVLGIEPGNAEAYYELALLEERRHNIDESDRLAQVGLNLHPHDGFLLLAKSRARRRLGKMSEALDLLQQIASSNAKESCRVSAYYEMGAILDKQKRYDEAFAAFDQANSIDRMQLSDPETGMFYNKETNKGWFESLRAFYTRDRLKALLPFLPRTAAGPQPLFIVGFPRSGTTLTEQMLSAHSKIHGGDELAGLNLIEEHAAAQTVNNLQPYPTCLAAIPLAGNQDVLLKLRDYYLHVAGESQAINPDKPLFTDKMPLNENHMGLIRILFPASPIVHVVRHPLDVILSCFTNQLYHGNACALSLDTLAYHFNETWRLVDHYVAEMDLRYVRLRYEDLLDDPESEMRRLFDFIGEDWDPRCLEFHKSSRVARTASYAQINQPLYRTSQERWRAYRRHLGGVIPQLAQRIEQLGYRVD